MDGLVGRDEFLDEAAVGWGWDGWDEETRGLGGGVVAHQRRGQKVNTF